MTLKRAAWGEVPDDVEFDDDDDPREVDPPDLGELADHLHATLREYEESGIDADEPEIIEED